MESLCEIKIGMEPHDLDVRVPLDVPTSVCPVELAHRLIQHHNIPINLHLELSDKLQKHIQNTTEEFYQKQDKQAIHALKSGKIDIASVATYWSSRNLQVKSHYESEGSDSEQLAQMYHSLVHSPSVVNLLALEHSMTQAMTALVAQKEENIKSLRQRQSREMSEAVSAVGNGLSDDDINNLATRQLEDSQLTEVQWESTISALKEEQMREFKNFVTESFSGKEVTTPVSPKDFVIGSSDAVMTEAEITLEESFTIHLGAQMKQMHNLRLLAADALQLCKYQSHDQGDIPPQRIQTSMSLYSHNLNGLVLLVDDRINTYTDIKHEFSRVCRRSTEFHFPDLEDQLESIRDLVPMAVQWRRDHPPTHYDSYDEPQPPPQIPQHLKAGDYYLSRHSNLADVHTVFHMIVDDTVRSGDINSRHPVILGLRNVLKVACLADITTLTVPLLLTNNMSEEMTISWCQKRAELVYKCVKGFMMEMSSWGGAEMKNMQFLVPKDISAELFQTLASMLPSIFRVSNPLVIKS